MKPVQWWTLIISLLFVFAVGTTLIIDLSTNGPSLETIHKTLHIAIGFVGLKLFQKVGRSRAFVLANVLLFGLVAFIGWSLPDYLGLDAFNRVDTILHTIVSASGIIALSLRR